jgi:hypothetical protein
MRKIEETDVKSPGLPDARIIAQALPIEEAEDLLPEVAELAGVAGTHVLGMLSTGRVRGADDVVALLPALPELSAKLSGGRLRQLHKRACRGVSVILTDDRGEKTKYDMQVDKERGECLDARPDLYLRILLAALKVTFARFFPGLARLGQGKKASEPT